MISANLNHRSVELDDVDVDHEGHVYGAVATFWIDSPEWQILAVYRDDLQVLPDSLLTAAILRHLDGMTDDAWEEFHEERRARRERHEAGDLSRA